MKRPANNCFSYHVSAFQDRIAPENGYLAGYGALCMFYELKIPLPDKLALITKTTPL